jgi:hypothetical protein
MAKYMVLNDGETFCSLTGCKIVEIDDDELESLCKAEECEVDAVISDAFDGNIGKIVQEF